MHRTLEQWQQATYETAMSPRPLEAQAIDTAQGLVRGIAVTWDHLIEGFAPTVFHNGCFDAWMQSHPPAFVKLLWSHDPEEPLGKMVRLENRAGGLWIEAQVPLTERTRHFLTLAKEGVASALSVGFTPNPQGEVWESQDGRPVRHLKAGVELYEVSLCCWGMDDRANVEEVQGRRGDTSQAALLQRFAAIERLAAGWAPRAPVRMSLQEVDAALYDMEQKYRELTALRILGPRGDSRPTWQSEYVDLRQHAMADNRVTPAGILFHDAAQAERLAPLASQHWLRERAGVQERLAALDAAERQLQHANAERWAQSR
jgi:uncharacterized protein